MASIQIEQCEGGLVIDLSFGSRLTFGF